jgi:hypothetical protein
MHTPPPTDKVLPTNTANQNTANKYLQNVSPLSIETEIRQRHYRMQKIINRFTGLAEIRRHINLPTSPEQLNESEI